MRIKVSEKEKVGLAKEKSREHFQWNRDESRDVDAVALVFSTIDADVSLLQEDTLIPFQSFDYVLDLYREILHDRYFPIVVVENKIDQLEHSVIDKTFVEERLRKSHLRLYRYSPIPYSWIQKFPGYRPKRTST